jgi:hypothetical protein
VDAYLDERLSIEREHFDKKLQAERAQWEAENDEYQVPLILKSDPREIKKYLSQKPIDTWVWAISRQQNSQRFMPLEPDEPIRAANGTEIGRKPLAILRFRTPNEGICCDIYDEGSTKPRWWITRADFLDVDGVAVTEEDIKTRSLPFGTEVREGVYSISQLIVAFNQGFPANHEIRTELVPRTKYHCVMLDAEYQQFAKDQYEEVRARRELADRATQISWSATEEEIKSGRALIPAMPVR